MAFDPVSLRTRGSARPVLDDVLWSPAGYPQFSMNAGLLAYVRSSNASPNLGKVKLAVADRRGEMSPLPLPADNYLLPRLSPAGDKLVVQVGATRGPVGVRPPAGYIHAADLRPRGRVLGARVDLRRSPSGVHHVVRQGRRAGVVAS